MKIQSFDNKKVHNFSIGTLDAYFKINELLCRNKVEQHNGFFFMNRNVGKMTMVYDSNRAKKNISALKEYQKRGPIYAIDPLDLDFPNKFVEILYDLSVVFDPKSYKNAKKRYQRIVYPFKNMDKHGIKITHAILPRNYDDIVALHDKWTEFKLNDPRTFKMMFPTGRYIHCVDTAINNVEIKNKNGLLCDIETNIPKLKTDYLIFEARNDVDDLVAVRVISIQNNVGYDLAFFGNTWDTPSQMMHQLDVIILKILKEDYGLRYFNCGAASSTNLKSFKSHIPCTELISWRYKKSISKNKKIVHSDKKLVSGFGIV